MVNRPKEFYNLDMILSVGYRVKSARGIAFRRWANVVLKEYLLRGYTINHRLEQLERRVARTEEKIDFFVKTALPPVDIIQDRRYNAACSKVQGRSLSLASIYGVEAFLFP